MILYIRAISELPIAAVYYCSTSNERAISVAFVHDSVKLIEHNFKINLRNIPVSSNELIDKQHPRLNGYIFMYEFS